MTRLLVATLFFGAVLAGHLQAQAVSIQGRVVSEETGDPLTHARVLIYNDATPLAPIYTDGRGDFTSSALPPGRYRLTARKPGYALTTVSPLNLNAAEPLLVRMPRAAAITGRIVDGFGEPAAGVQVSLLASRPAPAPSVSLTNAATTVATIVASVNSVINRAVKRAVTDDLGEYRFGNLPAGTYFVVLTMLQRPIDPVNLLYYPGVTASAEATGIELKAGEEHSGVDFNGIGTQLSPATTDFIVVPPLITINGPNGNVQQQVQPQRGAAKIRGRVTRTDGLPVAHATVSTRTTGRMQGIPTTNLTLAVGTQTDDDGAYELADLPPGKYRITAAKLGYTSTVLENVDVAEGQTKTRNDLTLPRSSAVTGRVLDDFGDPVENVIVNLTRITFEGGRRRLVGIRNVPSTVTDDAGRYRLYGLEPGQYIINAAPGLVLANQPASDLTGYAPTYFPGTSNAREAQLVPVPRSQDMTGLDFVLVPTPTASISGVKLGSDGEPMGGSLMLMESQRSGAIITPAAGARIQPDGRFEFPNVAPGDYVIQADRGRFSGDVEGDFVSQYVTINGNSVSDLKLQALPGSTISGRVVFEGDGPPPSPRRLTIVPDRADLDRTPNAGSIARGTVHEDLTFEMSGIHGPRRIGTDRIVSGWGLKSVTANGVDITDAVVQLGAPSQSLSDVQVTLTNRLTEIMVTVTDARGNPTRDYTLLVFPDDRERWYAGSRYFKRAAPEQAGYAVARGLPPGDYLVVALSNAPVLRDSADAWQDPEYLEVLMQRAVRTTLTEARKLSISARVVTP